MSRLAYDTAEALIYDPVSANRSATRSVMYSLGFRRIEVTATLDAFLEQVRKAPPDLALCEAQGADEELCRTIQKLRQGWAVYNPFLVVIVTAWEKSSGLVRRVVDSGADDLVLRPFSTSVLGARIDALVERRKGFVITTDYVGPDRRGGDSTRPNNAELFLPPNSLRMKAKERMPPDIIAKKLEGDLREAREKLSGEKLRRDAFQAAILWRLIGAAAPGTPSHDEDVARLVALADGVERRGRASGFMVGEWCDSIQAAAGALVSDRTGSLETLGRAAIGLGRVFFPEKTEAQLVADVDATAAVINARNQPAMAS